MADVDPQLERARRDHTQYLARAQPLLDLAAAEGQVAAAVAAHDAGVAGLVLDHLLDRGQHYLGGEPALAEHDGGDLTLEKTGCEFGGLAKVRGADAEFRIDHRRVVD